MSLKVKLTSTILAFAMILGLLVIGVFAVPSATVNLGGTIAFTAENVYAKVSAVVSNSASDPTITPIVFNHDTEADEGNPNKATETWTNPLSFKSTGEAISIALSIENLASDRPLYAYVYDTAGKTDNLEKTKSLDGADYFNSQITVEANTTKTVTLTMSIKDMNTSVTGTYGYGVELSNTEFETLTTWDATSGQQLLTMGEYEGNPVQWRLVEIDDMLYIPTETNAPIKGKGMFVQETKTVKQKFDSESTDYATSDIKAYLDTYATVLGLDDTNEIYNKIQERTMQDLYKGIGWAFSYDGITLPQYSPWGTNPNGVYDLTTESTDSVKFWLLSVEEAYRYIGYGEIENDTIPYSWLSEVKSNLSWQGSYWLRSSDDCNYQNCILYISSNGKWETDGEVSSISDVRAAFYLNF